MHSLLEMQAGIKLPSSAQGRGDVQFELFSRLNGYGVGGGLIDRQRPRPGGWVYHLPRMDLFGFERPRGGNGFDPIGPTLWP